MKAYQKVEFASNILIIVVSLILGVILVQKYFLAPSKTLSRPNQIDPVIGSKVNLPDMAWSPQSKTLILAMQTGCHFCNESMPFYKRLIEATKDKNIKLVAVFPTSVEDSTAHLDSLGIKNLEVKQMPLTNIQVRGTPTLILTNSDGEILNFWVGKLPPEKEAEVIDKLSS